ncbi:MAG: hypothetical protein JWM41_2736 [Gemmatimonadetes bacterium]|nr:hypothetical protein [Gemmatimonadota bacterium]
MKRVASAVWDNIGFVCVAIVLIYCVVHAFDPPRLNWGDSGSDYNVMIAGRNFQKYGFLKMHLTPVLMDASLLVMPEDQPFIYTHYPQLPDLMNGVLRTVFGLSDIVQFRLVALLVSFSALVFVYKLLSYYWGRRTAQIALALWVVNPLWIQHADYLHHGPYGAFFGFGCLYFLVRYFQDETRTRFLVAAGVFMMFTVFASYDYWFFAPLLVALATVANYRAVFRAPVIRVLGTLAVCAIGAVLLKLATNAWAFGSVRGLLDDLHFQFAERATDTVTRSSFQTGVWDTMYGRVERFFTLLLFPIAAFWAIAPLLRRRFVSRWPALGGVRSNPIFLLLAALPFLYVFREIWIGQYYPGLLVLPFYAVASAAMIVLLLQTDQRIVRVAGGVLLAGLLANSLDEDASFKKAFFRREDIRTLKAQLDSVSRPGQRLLINNVSDPLYRYYFDRQTVQLILNPPGVVEIAIASHSNPLTHPRSGTPEGAIFVQHKNLKDEMFDKGYYYILGRYRLWKLWGNPPKYRDVIDTLMIERDSVLMSKVARVGHKLYETNRYVVWRVKP